MRRLLAELPPAKSWTPPAAPVATANGLRRAATTSSASTPRPTCWQRPAPNSPLSAFEEGDLAALPLSDASVDAALCALVLVHLSDLRPAVAELARVVRPGGRIVISDVHPFLVALGWQAQFRSVDGGAGFVRLHRHLPSTYAQAAAEARLDGRQSLRAPAAGRLRRDRGPDAITEANAAAWAGLPGIIVWDLVKP